MGDCNDPPSTESGTEGGSGGGAPGNTPPENAPPGNTPPGGNAPPVGDPTPEDKEDDKDDDPEETPSSSHSTPTSTQSATSTSQSSGTTTSTSTSSSSSTCSQVVASSCIYSVACQPGQSENQCPTITQGCQTSTACSIVGTTLTTTSSVSSTSSFGPRTHAIYPTLSSLPQVKMTVQNMLQSFFPGDLNAVTVTDEPQLGVLFWEAVLTEDQALQIRATNLVRRVNGLVKLTKILAHRLIVNKGCGGYPRLGPYWCSSSCRGCN